MLSDIKLYVARHEVFLQKCQCYVDSIKNREAAVEVYLKSLVEVSLEAFAKGEWVGIVRAKARAA